MDTIQPFRHVTRVEVIDASGRTFVRYYPDQGVAVAVQDDGRTLKVFVDSKSPGVS